jgi:hypothetical protein
MERELKYVSPEYKARLDNLAELLVTSRRFGRVVLYASEMGSTTARSWMVDTQEMPAVNGQLQLDIPDNIEVGLE